MRLVYFEMRKSWLKLPMLALVLILIFINMYKIRSDFAVNNAASGSEDLIRKSKFSLYEDKLRGKVTNEKIDFIKDTSDSLEEEVKGFAFSTEYDEERYTGYVFGDYRLFDGTLKNSFRYIVLYSNTSNKISQKAYENIAFYKEHNNTFEQRKNAMIFNAYQGRKLDSFYLTQGSTIFFNYDFSCLLILALIIVAACQSFSKENESKMNILISTSAGMKSTVIAKCLSSVIFCGVVSITFNIIDLLTINHFFNLEGLTQPIYSLNSFATCPFNVSVFLMIIYVLVIRLTVYIFISVVVIFISYICKRSIMAFILSFTTVCGFIFLQEFKSCMFNPVEMLSIRKYLCEFSCINFLNFPIYSINARLFVCIVLCALISCVLYFLNRRKSHAKI
jgi:hypothetical protein